MSFLPLALTLVITAGDTPSSARGLQLDDQAIAVEDVEVLGRRGRAIVDPELELDGALIDALGAYDIGEVIRRLTEDYALGEAPVIIVNGRRMADAGVFSGFPPDALVRVEILPPGASALYGAVNPSRRVVNIVLQPRFNSRDGRTSLRRPTAGGMTTTAGDLRQSSILDGRTRQLGLQVNVVTALRAGDRDMDGEHAPGSETVTLRSPTVTVAGNLSQTGQIGGWSASLNTNARVQETSTVSLVNSRLPGPILDEGQTIESRRRMQGLTVTGGLNGDWAGWSVQTSLNGVASWINQTGLSVSDTRQQALTTGLNLSRPLIELPAGPLLANFSGRASASRSVSESSGQRRGHSDQTSELNGNLSIPVLRRSSQAGNRLDALGELSMSFGGKLSETNAGRGEGMNAAVAWSPTTKLRLNAMWSTTTQSLPDQQRFDPEYYGEQIRVFDFATGVSTDVLPILGGNPDLRRPSYDRFSMSASAGPFTVWALQASVNYQRAGALDEIGTVPDPTPEVEAAFADRFQRDADGQLITIDRRPINFVSSSTDTLTTTLGAAYPLGDATGRGRPGVVRVTLNHSWQLANTTTIRMGLPEMDRLTGDGGGLSRHQVGFLVDFRQGQWGLNGAARWQTGYRSRRDSGRDGPDDLRVATFSAVDLRISYQFEHGLPSGSEDGPPPRGLGPHLELEIANLFDERSKARLGDGRAAPGFGRYDRDPVGRTFLVTLKKRF